MYFNDHRFSEAEELKRLSEVDNNDASPKLQVLKKIDDLMQSRHALEIVFRARDLLKQTKADILSKFALADLNYMLELGMDQIERLVKRSGQIVDAKWVFVLRSYLAS
jgi:hypothetical protein